jgi:hypothetical protein
MMALYRFLTLFDSRVNDGLPPMLVTKVFLFSSMAAFRAYIADDALLRRMALL